VIIRDERSAKIREKSVYGSWHGQLCRPAISHSFTALPSPIKTSPATSTPTMDNTIKQQKKLLAIAPADSTQGIHSCWEIKKKQVKGV
jgi:hypothetical protein